MTAHFKNFIAGEWIDGDGITSNINPSNTGDVVGRIRPRQQGPGPQGDRGRQGQLPEMVAFDAAGAARRPAQDLDRNPRPQGRARPAAGPRGRQDAARGHRRSHPRRPDLRLLRRRGAAAQRREAGLGATRRRGRGHARPRRRHRADHAVEFPHRDPGLEDRSGALLRQLRGVQARRSRSRLAATRWPRSSAAPDCRRASSTSSWAAGRWSARCSSTTRTSRRSASRVPPPPAARSRRPASTGWPSSSSR